MEGEQLCIWRKTSFDCRFFTAVNLGLSIPGYFPGDLAMSKSDIINAFKYAIQLGVDAVRLYTIWPPMFYETLIEFNSGHSEPLMIIQGIYPSNGVDQIYSILNEYFQ